MTALAGLASAPVPSLGVVLVGCPDCRAVLGVLGVEGARGLVAALAVHRRECPVAADVCPGCGCEAELYPRGDGWRCGDCLAERLSDTLTGPPAPAPAQSGVRAVPTGPRRGEHQGDADPERPERAVA
jgi:hypothetical protein